MMNNTQNDKRAVVIGLRKSIFYSWPCYDFRPSDCAEMHSLICQAQTQVALIHLSW